MALIMLPWIAIRNINASHIYQKGIKAAFIAATNFTENICCEDEEKISCIWFFKGLW